MGLRRDARLAWPALALAIIAFAVGESATASASTARAPCTRSALQAGLLRGPARTTGHDRVVHPFGCADGWAFAAVLTPEAEGTGVFRATGTRWYAVDRERPCLRHEIPRRIRHDACDSN